MQIVNALKVSKSHVYTADFETTSTPNLEKDGYVRVWLFSLVSVDDYKAYYGYDIPTFLNYVDKLEIKICYFHNLKFDGNFLVSYFLENNIEFELLAPNGNWFALRYKGCEFRDSLKKFKMTVKGLSVFLGMELKHNVEDETGKKPWDYYIPDNYMPDLKSIEYCIHDSRIVAKAISLEWDNGRKRLTSSSESYHFAKNFLGKDFDRYFPKIDLTDDEFIRKSYRGGVCSVNPIYQGLDLDDVYGYDVNGLYGSVMDECILPVGLPYDGEPLSSHDLYVISFDCEFQVKKGMFPFLQIKRNLQYYGRESEYLSESNGITRLTLTSVDYELFKKHYHIFNDYGYEYKSFIAKPSVLSPIIQHNLKMKQHYSEPEHYDTYLRTVFKDNTNMLYGSFGLNPNNDIVKPFIDDDGIVKLEHIDGERPPRYIPMATFITSYARRKTIEAIQANYSNWIYSDTDSMYLTKPAKNIKIHQSKSGYWKYEGWNGAEPFAHGRFLRQKTYILVDENYKPYSKYDKYGNFISEIKCAGMSDKIKETSVTWDNFRLGTTFGKRLTHCVVKGGVCLKELDFTIGD